MSGVPSSFDFSDIPDDDSLDSGTLLKEGTYHFVVDAVDVEHASKKKGTRGVEFVCQVLAGTENQKGKKLYERFYYPTPDQSEDGRLFMLKRIGKIARVLDLIAVTDLGKAGVVIPWEKGAGRQFVATISHNHAEDDVKKEKPLGSQIEGLKIYRVTDQDVAEIPKDKEMLAWLGKAGSNEGNDPPAAATSIADL
jgi:hypothetical protein